MVVLNGKSVLLFAIIIIIIIICNPFSILILFSYNMKSAKEGEFWKNSVLCIICLLLEMTAYSNNLRDTFMQCMGLIKIS